MYWYVEVLLKYADFYGRARRKEYWMFFLYNTVISYSITGIEYWMGNQQMVGLMYSIVTMIPSIAVSVRRLHDTGRSGWWNLIAFVPIVGFVVLIVWLCQDSHAEPNQYGPNPKIEG